MKSYKFKEKHGNPDFSEKYPTRMSFRRPPSDVDRMTSLRVDNLPYSAVMEVALLCDFQVATTFRKHYLMNVDF